MRWDEGSVYAEAPHRVMQQVVRAAVQCARRNHVGPCAHQRSNRKVQRGLSACGADRAHAAFQRGYALLEYSDGRVRNARIDVS
jgi:hypothetical protein